MCYQLKQAGESHESKPKGNWSKKKEKITPILSLGLGEYKSARFLLSAIQYIEH